MNTITQGRYTAHINSNQGGFYVVVTRDGDCLHSINGRHYSSAKAAETGARKMIAKAAA